MPIQLSNTPKSFSHVMLHVVWVATLCLALFSSEQTLGQGVNVLPPGGDAGHPETVTCLILERVGTVDKVASRVLSFGIHGKQFQYIEGRLPKGLPFHDRFTDRDVRELQTHGSEVVILNSDFMPDELQQARDPHFLDTVHPADERDGTAG